MQDEAFRDWLAAQGQAAAVVQSRVANVRGLEKQYGDLDAAFDRDGLGAICGTLEYSAADHAADRANPSRMTINGDLRSGLATYRAALKLYQQFRMESSAGRNAGHEPSINWAEAELRRRYDGPSTDTAKMVGFHLKDGRAIALQRDVAGVQLWLEEDAARGMPPAPTVRHYLAAQSRHSNLPQRLKHAAANGADSRPVMLVTVDAPATLGALLDWYEGGIGMRLDPAALARLRDAFLAKYPDFRSFEDAGGYAPEEDEYKRPIIAEAQRLVTSHSADSDAVLGGALLDLAGSKQHNLLGYFKTYELLRDWRAQSGGAVDAAAGALVRSAEELSAAVQAFVEAIWPIMAEGQTSKPYGDSRIVATLLLALTRSTEAVFVRTTPFNNAAVMLLGRKLYGWNPLTAAEYAATLAMAEAIFVVMRDDWRWHPRDLWDVQGFLWCTCQAVIGQQAEATPSPEIETATMPNTTNLILYGPPGTGKTYATARHAVRLCGEETDGLDRDALMARYTTLSEAGRIEFVTFHQSTAYEEFVEGLRPVQGAEGSVGFELRPTPGVFRRIARRAETSTGPGASDITLGGRQVFKMSIGEASNPDDAALFEEAIAGGYTLLGFHDIDWSDARFADRGAMIEAVRAVDGNAEANGTSGRVQMPFIFRNWMKEGDLVVVSKGNGLFRAIGEITGEYRFLPREGGGYAHRRAVRWLWIDRAGVPVNEIYAWNFTQKSAYALTRTDLNVPALERYANSQRDPGSGTPEPFVLVIDEINRANISKVFGELITLLEADKRIGADNELRVRLPYSGDTFGVPANLHIVGTMNTADRSIALLDTALRRRFTFEELMPDPELLTTVKGINLKAVLTTLNDRIEYLFDREHQIGHAYFLPCKTRDDVDEVMRHKVIPLLQEYFYEDWTKVAAVLGDVFEDNGRTEEGGFLIRTPLASPFGKDEDEGRTRYRWTVRAPATFTYARLGG